MKIGIAQYNLGMDLSANLRLAEKAVEHLAAGGAEVICLPELFQTPYFCQVQETAHFDFAETVDGPSVTAMCKVAARLGIVLIVPWFERRSAGVFHNSAAVIDADGTCMGVFRKLHIPQDPGFEEKFYFTPSDDGFPCWNTRHGRIGVLICWDQWFPEAARAMALNGAEVLFYPTAIGWLPSEKAAMGQAQHCAWETVQRGHAVANGCHVVAVNRVGTEAFYPPREPIEFWGSSFVADPYGQVLARLSSNEPEYCVLDLDLAGQETTRRIWPFFRDRRIDAYNPLLQRWIDG